MPVVIRENGPDEVAPVTVDSFVFIEPRDAFRESLMKAMQPLPFPHVYSVSGIDALPVEIVPRDGRESVDGNNEDVAHSGGAAKRENTLVVLGTGSLDRDGIWSAIEKLHKLIKHVRIALLADRLDDVHSELFNAGVADGIVPSTFGIKQLRGCFAIIGEGVAFAPHLRGSNGNGVASNNASRSVSDELDSEAAVAAQGQYRLAEILTERQIQVMDYVKLGKSNKFIAHELDLCESTVKVHVHEAMKRLGASSRTHASYIISNLLAAKGTPE